MEDALNFSNQKSVFEALQKMASDVSANLNILEERIDVNIQMEYFKLSKRVKENLNKEEITRKKDELFDNNFSTEYRKELLVSLASIDDVEIYRTIERFSKLENNILNDWAILALQESKMHLQSSLLDENQVFISTGLGGRGNKLRYFIVFISNENSELNATRRNIIESELKFGFKRNEAILEKITCNEKYAAVVCLLPIHLAISDLIKGIIDECNKMGNFLKENFLITNVKEFALDEIDDLILQAKETNTSDDHKLSNEE